MLAAALKAPSSNLHHAYPHWTYADQSEKHVSEMRPEADLHREVRAAPAEWFKLPGTAVSARALMCVCSFSSGMR